MEISCVSQPANPEALAFEVKSADVETKEQPAPETKAEGPMLDVKAIQALVRSTLEDMRSELAPILQQKSNTPTIQPAGTVDEQVRVAIKRALGRIY
jgi:hypothetical protein